MNCITINNEKIALNKEGFLIDRSLWSETVAITLAQKEKITLTQQHWKVIYLARGIYEKHEFIPPMRIFIRALNAELELVDTFMLLKLFSQNPLKTITKLAGLPKPKHCL